MAAKGSRPSGLGPALRAALLCAVPLVAGVAGVRPSPTVVILSVLGATVEGGLYAVRKLRLTLAGSRCIRPAGFFPLQLLGLYTVQLWLVTLHAATTDGDAAQAAAVAAGRPVLRGGALQDVEAHGSGGALQDGEAALQLAALQLVSAPAGDLWPDQPLAAGRGANFLLDADPATLRWRPQTISVVLPCAEEREYAFKTVKSIFETTPSDVLKEIVVVDDGSQPPLSDTHLQPDVRARYRVKVMRHEHTVGLIGAKKTGGDAASGDIVVFFDCHVAPQPGWHTDILSLISENYRRMVVPQITTLDVDTWTQRGGGGGGLSKCYLTWDADFKWFDSDDRYIAVISGGLLGMSRRWWAETGGYDTEMLGWGGENLDQSLRVWLCGGEIVVAPNSQVAHMWRDGSKKTSARYQHVGDTIRNRARAVYGWYGEFGDKLQHYPSFAMRPKPGPDGVPWYGTLQTFEEVRNELQGCRPFAWFLRRFKKVYEDGGLLPSEVFMLREERSGLCLHYQAHAGTSNNGREGANLVACNADNHRFFWHLGNLNSQTGHCCSGLRAWNTDQCLTGGQSGGKAATSVCSISGSDTSQGWSLREDGSLRRGNSCLGPGVAPGTIEEKPCLAFRKMAGARWTKLSPQEPLETQLYHKALREHPEAFKALEADSGAR